MQRYYSGSFKVKICEAKLYETFQMLGSKLDIYCKFDFNGKHHQSDVVVDGGLNPRFNQVFDLEINSYDIHNDIFIEMFSKGSLLGDTMIGFVPLKVSSMLINSEMEDGESDWFSIFKNNERIGLL